MLRSLEHAEDCARRWGLRPDRLMWVHDRDFKAGAVAFDCPHCGTDWKVVAREFRGGGVALRCAGCDSVESRYLLPLDASGLVSLGEAIDAYVKGTGLGVGVDRRVLDELARRLEAA